MKILKNGSIALIFRALTTLALSLSLNCSTPVTSGGSEAGNARITGHVTSTTGSPLCNTIVTLRPVDFNPITDARIADSCIDTTDSNGAYYFFTEDQTTYTIEAVQQHSRLRALISGVTTGTNNDTIPPCALTAPGTIRILPPEERSGTTGYAFIPGTPFFVNLSSAYGYAILDSVPAGIIPQISYVHRDTALPIVLTRSIMVTSDDTVTVSWQNWSYSEEIILNTSATGADCNENVYNFPALIRLPAGNFTFDQSQSQGNDIRFTSSKGTVLPHEIELWDSAGNNAAVWVNVDTLWGNNATQSITMYWGNPEPSSPLTTEPVFDTTEGFEGIWHLSEAPEDTVQDATPNHYNGISPDTARPQQESGIIGNCKRFDGTNDFISMPNTANSALNFPGNGYFTVSAWISLDTIDSMPHLIVAKGYSQYFLRCTYFPADIPLWEFSDFSSPSGWEASSTAATAREWALLTGVRDGNRHLLYCNGTLVDSTPSSYVSPDLTRSTASNVTIGRFMELVTLPNNTSGYCFFKGAIDEVRIDRGARSAAWIRLCYINQRPDNQLVAFTQHP